MTLFSWFVRNTKVNSRKNNQASIAQELSTFNKNSMWPIAKVRSNTTVQQQHYVNATSNIKNETKIKILKEHVNHE